MREKEVMRDNLHLTSAKGEEKLTKLLQCLTVPALQVFDVSV